GCVKLRRADQRRAAVDPDVDRHRRIDSGELAIEGHNFRRVLVRSGGGVERMARRAGLALENHHQAIAGGLVDVAVLRANDFEKAREIVLDHPVEPLRRQVLRHARRTIARKLENYPWIIRLSRCGGSCSDRRVYPSTSRNKTETSASRFSSSCALGFCSSSFVTASGTHLTQIGRAS